MEPQKTLDKPKDDVSVELAKLRAEVEQLRAQSQGESVMLEEPSSRTMLLRMNEEGKPIVDWGRSEVRSGDNGVANLFVQIFVLQDDGTEKEEWVSFKTLHMDYRQEKAKILKEEMIDRSERQGSVNAANVDEYKMIATGVRVPLKVTIKEPVFTIEMANKRQIKVRKANI